MTIKELRVSKGLTQPEVSTLTQIPLRTYKNYENDPDKIGTIKYNYILEALSKIGIIDEEHGIVPFSKIDACCQEAFSKYNIRYIYIFGAYATNTQTEADSIEILVSTDVSLKYSGIYDHFKDDLKKKINLFSIEELIHNTGLLDEILDKGIKIVKR